MLKPPPTFTPITLRRQIILADTALPAGARGTVMDAYADGLAYAVEFGARVVTVDAADIQT